MNPCGLRSLLTQNINRKRKEKKNLGRTRLRSSSEGTWVHPTPEGNFGVRRKYYKSQTDERWVNLGGGLKPSWSTRW